MVAPPLLAGGRARSGCRRSGASREGEWNGCVEALVAGEGGVVKVRALVGVMSVVLLVVLGAPAFARARVSTTTFRAPLARPMWCNTFGCAGWDYYGNVALDAQVEPATTNATLPTGTVTFSADGSPIGM